MIIVMRIHLYILQAFDLGGYIKYVILEMNMLSIFYWCNIRWYKKGRLDYVFCSCCVWHVNLFCYHHLITWYCPLHMNPVHSLFTAQSACPWFCNGSVRFSSLPHIWHSARCRFSSKLVTHDSCWMIMMTIETTRLNDFILLILLVFIFLRSKDIFLVVVNGWDKVCNRDDENLFLLGVIWICVLNNRFFTWLHASVSLKINVNVYIVRKYI